jgi:hypothetical protein
MILVSSLISIITMVVTFGMIEYSNFLKPFTNFMVLEISLAITLFLWAINSLYRSYTPKSKKTFFYYIFMSGLFMAFIFYGVY